MAKGKFDMSEFLRPAAAPESDTGREQIVYLPLDQLRADENNFYSLDGIDELAANIELIGLQQPIRVRKDGDGYIIVSGHRRSAALRLLVEDGQKRFAEAPCIIERDDGESPAMRELRLICANSDTRKMSSADISKQLSRMKELIYELSKEGYEFKGKIRDFAAEAIGISKTKAARIQFIDSHLDSEFAYLWEKEKINESVAYELAHFAPSVQKRLAKIYKGGKNLPQAEKLKRLCEIFADGATYEPTMMCPDGKACTHGDAALRHDASLGGWETPCKSEKCCLDCDKATRDWSPCDRMCAAAQKRRSEKSAKEKEKQKSDAEKARKKAYAQLQATCARMVRAADAAGLDDKAKAYDGCTSDGGHTIGLLRRYARGEFKPDERPYFYDFELKHCSTIGKCAQTLHCTTDYLLGLTEELMPTKAASSPEWLPLDAEHWPEEGALVVLSYPTGLGGSAYLTARCCGGVSDQYPFISTDAGISVQDVVEFRCDSWLLISERQRGRKDDCEACKASHPQCNKCCKACDDPCNAAQWCRKDEK